MSKSHTQAINDAEQNASRYFLAFKATAKDRAALTPEDVRPVNVDIPTVVAMFLGVWPQIEPLLPTLHGCPFTRKELSLIASVHSYALAMTHAQAVFATTESVDPLPVLIDRAITLRETLLGDAQTLARHGLLDGNRLTEIRQVPGYKPLAFDLLSLGDVFRGAWANIQGKTPVVLEMLEEAETLADQILVAVGARSQSPTSSAQATLDRQQSFALFYRAYEQLRRGIGFVRWNEGDADTIAPSIYSGRGNSNHKKKDDSSAPSTPPPGSTTSDPPAAASTPPPAPVVTVATEAHPELPAKVRAAE